MRYPVGYRPTFAEALEAALEAANMTGLRYRAYVVPSHGWQFGPVETPDPTQHFPTRV